ncbi:MAG: hypothetical protein GMKNLPBB_00181 [Myxococcota bacterium]|nr:hypothetical protein [Myxococcota bacterium]
MVGMQEVQSMWSMLKTAALRFHRDEDGQAIVESAIILPLMIFTVLGVIQLTMIQHAKVMNEYAAYQAARAGIVWNGDQNRMTNAALISLVPTMGRADNANAIVTFLKGKLINEVTGAVDKSIASLTGFINGVLGKIGIPGISGIPDISIVRVSVFNPQAKDLKGKNVDFDDPKNQKLTRLEIQCRYLYNLRIPFANWAIHTIWLATQAKVLLRSEKWVPGSTLMTSKTVEGRALDARLTAKLGTLTLMNLWRGNAEKNLHIVLYMMGKMGGYYFMPMYSTYSMRMQSNPYEKAVKKGW